MKIACGITCILIGLGLWFLSAWIGFEALPDGWMANWYGLPLIVVLVMSAMGGAALIAFGPILIADGWNNLCP